MFTTIRTIQASKKGMFHHLNILFGLKELTVIMHA